MHLKNKSPGSVKTVSRAENHHLPKNYTRKKHLRKFDHERLPSPIQYYSCEFPGLKIKFESAKVKCCFHEDNIPSLSINLVEGYFKCFACGAKGCDVLAFHMKRYGLNFITAVTLLGAWENE